MSAGCVTVALLCLTLAIVAVAAAYSTFDELREKARASSCGANEKQVAVSLLQYCQDWDGRLPHPNADWTRAVEPYTKSEYVLICPTDHEQPSYQLVPKLRPVVPWPEAGPRPFAPSETVMVLESDDGRTVAWRHRGHANFAFLDGHTAVWRERADAPRGYESR